MHVVFFNVLGAGHVNPTLPVVKALTDRGDRVTYFSYPARRPAVESMGADYRNYGDDDFTVARFHEQGMFPTQLWPAAVGLMPYLLDQLNELAPDLVVFDTFAPWGHAAAEFAGIPTLASVSTFVPSRELRSVMLTGPGGSELAIDEVNRTALETLRTTWNQSYDDDDFPMRFGAVNLVYTAAELNPPIDYRNEQFEFIGPMMRRPSTATDDDLIETISADPRKVIYLSMGTILGQIMKLGDRFYAPFFDALGREDDYLVVMSTGGVDPNELSAPANFVVRPSVPQLALLPHLDAFITHAGMNSTTEALYHGVPLVAVPFFGDQLMNAEVITQHGCGVAVDTKTVDATAVATAIDTVLAEDSYRTNAAAASRALRQTGGVARALEVIDGVASRRAD